MDGDVLPSRSGRAFLLQRCKDSSAKPVHDTKNLFFPDYSGNSNLHDGKGRLSQASLVRFRDSKKLTVFSLKSKVAKAYLLVERHEERNGEVVAAVGSSTRLNFDDHWCSHGNLGILFVLAADILEEALQT